MMTTDIKELKRKSYDKKSANTLLSCLTTLLHAQKEIVETTYNFVLQQLLKQYLEHFDYVVEKQRIL